MHAHLARCSISRTKVTGLWGRGNSSTRASLQTTITLGAGASTSPIRAGTLDARVRKQGLRAPRCTASYQRTLSAQTLSSPTPLRRNSTSGRTPSQLSHSSLGSAFTSRTCVCVPESEQIAHREPLFVQLTPCVSRFSHLPWGAPASYFDAYPPATDLPLAQHKLEPVGMPPVAYHHCQWGPFPWPSSRGVPVEDGIAGEARRGYYAALSFADHLVGEVLDALDAIGETNRTITLLTSDQYV
jgi:hypothetical protein